MTEQKLRELVYVVSVQDGISIARASKKLAIGYSQLYRMLAVLGRSEGVGGLDLVEVRQGEPPRLHLTLRGREAITGQANA